MQKRPGSFKPIHFVTTLIAAGALLAGTVQASPDRRHVITTSVEKSKDLAPGMFVNL